MFAGLGGFRAGLDRAGGFQCIGHCEIDKYADASYRAIHHPGKEEVYYPDARKIDPSNLPDSGLLSHDKGRTFSVILTTLLQLGYSVEWMVLIRFFIPNGFAIWNAPGILPGGAADAARKDVQFQSLQTIRFAATALLWQLLLNTFNSNLEIGIHSADFGVP